MDAAMESSAAGPSGKSKKSSNSQASHVSTALSLKQKKLLTEKAEFAKAEGEMLGRAKAVFAQNIDGEANLKQSRKACDEISKLLERNHAGLQMIDMRLKTVSEFIKQGKETVKAMTNTKDGMDVLCARLEALKIRSEKEREILQEKFGQNMGTENVLALRNALNRLLRHSYLEERVSRLQKMKKDREEFLMQECDELTGKVSMLTTKFDAISADKKELQQQSDQLEAEMENTSSTNIYSDLNEIIAEGGEVRKHLEECTREWAETVTESSNLEEEEKKAVEEEQKVMEEIALLKEELEKLMGQENDDPEVISLHYRSIRDNLQAEMTVKVCAMQEEIRKAEIELNVAENEYASLASFLVGEQYEWPKEIEIITAEGKQLEEALIAERKASADFRSKGMEIDMECNRLDMERDAINSEMVCLDNEVSNIRKYLDNLVTHEKEETMRYETARSLLFGIPLPKLENSHLRSNGTLKTTAYDDQIMIDEKPELEAKYAHLREENGGTAVLKQLMRSGGTSDLHVTNVAEPLSENDFKQGAALRPQWLNTIDSDGSHAPPTKAAVENRPMGIVGELKKDNTLDSGHTGRIPSDLQTSWRRAIASNASPTGVVNASVTSRGYPLPPSAFGSPLSTGGASPVAGEGNNNNSDPDQSAWTEFSVAY